MYDPELSLGLPVGLSMTSGINAIAHAAEGLYSVDANPVISLMAQEGIAALGRALPVIKVNPGDVAARSDALYGAWLCGSVLGAVGMALHHTAFPGSISLRPSTLIALIQDYIKPLARYGFSRFFFINGHGGNVATLKAAFAETYAALADLQIPQGDQVRCRVANWYMGRTVHQLAQQLYGHQEGSHATPSEVALTQYAYPEAIKSGSLEPAIAPSGYPIYGAADFRRHYPDGRMGSNPALATPDHGRQFYEAAVKELANDYLRFLGES
ncbi:amidase [filamentous cyanobacterium CCP5]|nr:amidase [filamentous cyanobacterium CCP5]